MGEAIGYVLGEPGPIEAEQVNQGIGPAKDAPICWLEEGIKPAMTRFNRFEK